MAIRTNGSLQGSSFDVFWGFETDLEADVRNKRVVQGLFREDILYLAVKPGKIQIHIMYVNLRDSLFSLFSLDAHRGF